MANYTNPCGNGYCKCTGPCFAKLMPNISDAPYRFKFPESKHPQVSIGDILLNDTLKKEKESLRDQVKAMEAKLDLILNTMEKIKD